MINLKPEWIPEEKQVQKTRLHQWMKSLGFSTYHSFYQASIDRTDWFWREAEKAVGIQWKKPYEAALGQHSFMWPKWYQGGTLNITETAVDKWAEKEETKHRPAIIWSNEAGEEKNGHFLNFKRKCAVLQLAF